VARGLEYFYFQAGRGTKAAGPRISLPKDPQSPEFWNELRKAQPDLGGCAVSTINAVLDLYLTSPQFDALSDSTRHQYRRRMEIVRKAWGPQPAGALRPFHVRALLDGMARTPGEANSVLVVLKSAGRWALERGHIEALWAQGVKAYRSEGGHKPWTAEQCAAAEKHFTGWLRRAYFLARHTGQRGSDVVRMGFGDIEDGGIRVKPKKTGKKIGEIWVPIEPDLAAEMAAWERRPGPFLHQDNGKPIAKKSLDSAWQRARSDIPELAEATFHGLRASRVVELRRRGPTPLQIQDVVGMSPKMIERYCRFADKKANAMAAIIPMTARQKKDTAL
jgi:integrase